LPTSSAAHTLLRLEGSEVNKQIPAGLLHLRFLTLSECEAPAKKWLKPVSSTACLQDLVLSASNVKRIPRASPALQWINVTAAKHLAKRWFASSGQHPKYPELHKARAATPAVSRSSEAHHGHTCQDLAKDWLAVAGACVT
jgi:hypothetical protein